MRFDGKVALISGAGSGIGRATALGFGERGARVAVADIDRGRAEAVAAEIVAAGGAATAIIADAASPAGIEAMIGGAVKTFGGLDILINSAARGLQRPRNAMASLPNHLRNTFDINVLGPWFAIKEAAPLLEERGGGAIVNVSPSRAAKLAQVKA